jgi:hypothetical protein
MAGIFLFNLLVVAGGSMYNMDRVIGGYHRIFRRYLFFRKERI